MGVTMALYSRVAVRTGMVAADYCTRELFSPRFRLLMIE